MFFNPVLTLFCLHFRHFSMLFICGWRWPCVAASNHCSSKQLLACLERCGRWGMLLASIKEEPKGASWGIPGGRKPLLHQNIGWNVAYEKDKQSFTSLLWEAFSCELCSIENSAFLCACRLAWVIKALRSSLSLNSFILKAFTLRKKFHHLLVSLPPAPIPITCSALCIWLDFWHIFAYIRNRERIKV